MKKLKKTSVFLGFMFVVLFFATAVSAADSGVKTVAGDDVGVTWNVVRSVLALLVILGALVAVNVFLRKRYFGDGSIVRKTRRIRLVERFVIDQRRSLMLVRVDQRELLVGVGPSQFDLLSELPELAKAEEANPGEVSE
jgi:flagellar biogenesis protein FliO